MKKLIHTKLLQAFETLVDVKVEILDLEKPYLKAAVMSKSFENVDDPKRSDLMKSLILSMYPEIIMEYNITFLAFSENEARDMLKYRINLFSDQGFQ